MGNITGADVVLTLAIDTIFPIPQQLQGFGVDDVYDVPQIKSVETMMGVDGVLSAGFVFVAVPQTITLQGDSISNLIFDTWNTQQQAGKTVYRCQGLIRLPGIATKFTMVNGALTGYKPAPAVKKLIQPRVYEITWESIAPAPTA